MAEETVIETTVVQRTVLEELLDVLNSEQPFPPKSAGETEQVFLVRLIDGVNKLSDAGWKKVSPTAQNWYNGAAGASNAGNPVPTIPGFQPDLIEQEKKVQNATLVSPPAANNSGSPKRGIMHRTREIAMDNPEIAVAAVVEQLKGEGWTVKSEDTIWLCIQEVKNVLKAAQSAGYLVTKVEDPQ